MLVDFVNAFDFPGAQALLPRAFAAARATARLKERLARNGVPAIYANDNFGGWNVDFKDLLQACLALEGTRGALARLIAPGPRDLTILKPRHSAFFGTPLDILLREMQARQVILAGVATDMCISASAAEAFMLGYDVWVPSDCTAAETPAAKQAALAHLRRAYKCDTRASL